MAMTPLKEVMTDVTSLGGTPLSVLAPLVAFFFDRRLFWQLVISLSACYIVAFAIRAVYWRERPDKSKVHNVIERIAQSSFPSLHATRATVLGSILMVFWNIPLLYVVLPAAIALTAYSRVYLKRHFPSDAIAGVILGILISLVTLRFI